MQEFLAFSAKKGAKAQKSCINAGYFNRGNEIEKNAALLHHYWDGAELERTYWGDNESGHAYCL